MMSELVIEETDHSIITRCVWQGQPAVLKTFRKSVEPRVITRWQTEVDDLKRVSGHPNITDMLGFSQSPLSITLRLERGLMLATFVDNRKMSTLAYQDCVILLSQMLTALCYVHKLGLVHDDVKPENIMWSPESVGSPAHAVLIDFGASFVSTRDTSVDFVLSGTPSYVAPEFLIKQKSPAVDMWALGVTMLFATGTVHLPDGDWFLPNVFEEGDARSALLNWYGTLSKATAVLLTAEEKKEPTPVTVSIELLVTRLLQEKPERRISSLDAYCMVGSLMRGAHD